MMRPTTGAALMSQRGLSGSGAVGSHGLKSESLHALAFFVGGFGHTLSQHAGLVGSGGSIVHLPLHPGQPGGGLAAGQKSRHALFFGSKFVSSHGSTTSGRPGSFGGSATS